MRKEALRGVFFALIPASVTWAVGTPFVRTWLEMNYPLGLAYWVESIYANHACLNESPYPSSKLSSNDGRTMTSGPWQRIKQKQRRRDRRSGKGEEEASKAQEHPKQRLWKNISLCLVEKEIRPGKPFVPCFVSRVAIAAIGSLGSVK